MKLFGFSLSEVLIALVIIGIVAAVSVPVINSTQDLTERVSRINNAYSVLSSAVDAANGYDAGFGFGAVGSSSSTEATTRWFELFLKPYIHTTKVCYQEKGCWNSMGCVLRYGGANQCLNANKAFPNNGNNNSKGMGNNSLTAILNDGTFICVNIPSDSNGTKMDGYPAVSGKLRVHLYFDINGDKGPNMLGEDVFLLYWNPSTYELLPAYGGKSNAEIDKFCGGGGDGNVAFDGYSCIMKYLKT